jgi:hypothetical protein
MDTLFDKDGYLNIEDIVTNNSSFQKIVEDGIITTEEKKEQSIRVVNAMKALEQTCSDEQIKLLKSLLSELSVMLMIEHM